MPRQTRKRNGGRRKKMRGGRRNYELHKAGKGFRELMCFTPRLNNAQEKQLLTTLRSIGDSANLANTKAHVETKKALAMPTAMTAFTSSTATTPAKISMANATANAKAATNNVKAAASDLQNAVQSTVNSSLNNAATAATKLKDTVTNAVTDNLDKLKKGAQGAIVNAANKLRGMATPASNAMVTAAAENNFTSAINKIKTAVAQGNISEMNLAAEHADRVARNIVADAEEETNAAKKETPDAALAGFQEGGNRRRSRRRRRRTRRGTRRRTRRRVHKRRRTRRRLKRRRKRRMTRKR